MAAAATRAWRPAAGWGWALEKYTHKYFVKKINEKYFNDPVAEPQKAEFPFAGWDGGGVLFEDVFSGAEDVVEDEVEPVQGLEVEEEHLPVSAWNEGYPKVREDFTITEKAPIRAFSW